MSEIGDTISAGSSLLNSVAKRAAMVGVSGGSLPELTGVARVNPIALVEDSLRGQSYIADILHTACNISSAYYLMAVNMLAEIGGVTVMERLEQLNPDRDPVKYILSHSSKIPKVSMEAMGDGYIDSADFQQDLPFKSRGRMTDMVFDASTNRYVRAGTLSCEATWEFDPTTGKMREKKDVSTPADKDPDQTTTKIANPASP